MNNFGLFPPSKDEVLNPFFWVKFVRSPAIDYDRLKQKLILQ
ncbi:MULTISPECIES: hypothetical protein [unclassified Microcoleus]|nr:MULTISPECIES: hypothetical protein [unclassified Microcoleus]